MATNFKRWVENPSSAQDGNVLPETGETSFANNTQRQNGYAAGQTISAKLLNTILHQLSICQVALFDQVCPDVDINYMSTLGQIKTALSRIRVLPKYNHNVTLTFTVQSVGTFTFYYRYDSNDATRFKIRENWINEPLRGNLHINNLWHCGCVALECENHDTSTLTGKGFTVFMQDEHNEKAVLPIFISLADNDVNYTINDAVTENY